MLGPPSPSRAYLTRPPLLTVYLALSHQFHYGLGFPADASRMIAVLSFAGATTRPRAVEELSVGPFEAGDLDPRLGGEKAFSGAASGRR